MSPKRAHKSPRLPWVSLNMAMSLDGKVATANRAISSFGSPRDHQHLYELRARADAVLCGATTVNQENADLGSGGERYEKQRLKKGLTQHNLRVIVSGSARLNPNARVFSEPGGPILVLVGRHAPVRQCSKLESRGAVIHRSTTKEVDLRSALVWLSQKWKVRHVHCEGGSTLNDALFREDLIDEIHLTVCPVLIGGRDAPTVSDGLGMLRLENMRRFQFERVRRVGNEHFWILSRAQGYSDARK